MVSHTCKHCGVFFTPKNDEHSFCCKGCEYVYQLIHDQGLGQYYDLKRGVSLPIKSVPYQARDYAWLEALVEKTETKASEHATELTFDLQGVSCVGCVWLVEKLFNQFEGAVDIRINVQRGTILVRWVIGVFDLCDFAQELQKYGYLIGPLDQAEQTQKSLLTVKIGLCSAFALNAMLFTLPRYLGMEDDFVLAKLFDLLTALFATLSLLLGGSYFINRAWTGLKIGVLHIDLPISLGIIMAYSSSLLGWLLKYPEWVYFDFVTIFVFLMLVGRWLQEYAINSNRRRLLQHRQLTSVIQLNASEENALMLDAIEQGMTVRIAPGQTVPVCSRLIDDEASLSLEWINGEAEPRCYRKGEDIPSGAMNISAFNLKLETKEAWKDSLLSRLSEQTVEDFRSKTVEQVLRWYIAVVIVIAIAGASYWAFASGNIRNSWQVAISILVVSCPCALGVAFPLINEIAVNRMQKAGLFIRNEGLWSRLSKIKKIIFDKTGTLTLESPQLLNPESIQQLTTLEKQALLRLINDNWHPICRSLREALLCEVSLANDACPEIAEMEVQEVIGFGLWAESGGQNWSLGRVGWKSTNASSMTKMNHDCEFCVNGQVLAAFAFQESVKADAAAEIDKLQQRGFAIHILSGDRLSKVKAMATELGVPLANILGTLTPDEKSKWINENGAHNSLMIGDGANDSLAFESAACCGTPVVDKNLLEHKADFYFLGRGLSAIHELFQVARLRELTIGWVFAFALLYNIGAVSLCLIGQMNPLLAAVLMPLSSLATIGIGVWRFKIA